MKKLIALIATLFFCTSAFAFETYESHYIEQALNAYETVADAIEARKESAEGTEPRLMLSNMMNNFIIQRNGLRKARGIFDQFKDSKNFSVKASSNLMSVNLLMIETQIDNVIKQIEKLLNLSASDFLKQAGTYTREIQESTAAINDLWDGYVKASSVVPSALIEGMDKDPMLSKEAKNKEMKKLVVSRKFVNDMKKKINTRFKEVLEKYNKKEYDLLRQYQVPVVLMNQFLNDRWKTIDEK